MPHECQTAGVSFPAVLATESDTEGNDPIYSLPKTGKISRIKSDKVQNSYEKTMSLLKMLKDNLKTWREDSTLREEEGQHGQGIHDCKLGDRLFSIHEFVKPVQVQLFENAT